MSSLLYSFLFRRVENTLYDIANMHRASQAPLFCRSGECKGREGGGGEGEERGGRGTQRVTNSSGGGKSDPIPRRLQAWRQAIAVGKVSRHRSWGIGKPHLTLRRRPSCWQYPASCHGCTFISYIHLHAFLLLNLTFIVTFLHASGVMFSCLMMSLKISLIISFVSSSLSLMSSALKAVGGCLQF